MAVVNPGGWGRSRETCAARLRHVTMRTAEGWAPREIANEIGLHQRTIGRYRHRARTGWVPTIGGSRATYTPDLARRVARLYASGLTQAQVAGRLGVGRTTVQGVMAAYAIPARPSGFPAGRQRAGGPPELARVVELYTSGLPAAEVARRVGVAKATARLWLVRAGVPLRGVAETNRMTAAARAARARAARAA